MGLFQNIYSSSDLLMLLQANNALNTAPKTYCFKYSCFLSFSCPFSPLFSQTPGIIKVNALSAILFFFFQRKKEVGHRVNLFYLSVPAFLSGTTGFKIFFMCLSLYSFRFPEIKVWILNPIPLSSFISPSLTCQGL